MLKFSAYSHYKLSANSAFHNKTLQYFIRGDNLKGGGHGHFHNAFFGTNP